MHHVVYDDCPLFVSYSVCSSDPEKKDAFDANKHFYLLNALGLSTRSPLQPLLCQKGSEQGGGNARGRRSEICIKARFMQTLLLGVRVEVLT